ICCVPATGDSIAVLGVNKKLLIFPLADLPEMGRGKGVRLQKYNEGGLADVRSFKADEGLIVSDRAGRSRVFEDLTDWQGTRAQAGRIRPKGFPSDGLMGPAFKNKL
ncbi:MAG: DNA topoisomerase IV subunit A, partial [Pseudomonadota bacterium]|nr:DNA topoisomerase IV subunit A [Pseudomonadota bacterium]